MQYTNGTETKSHRALQNGLGVSFPRGRPPAGWEVVDTTPPEPTLDDLKRRKRRKIEQARKQAEAEGVTVDGVRYAGDPENRQALREALEYADASGISTFDAWKTSDDDYLIDHPVAQVQQAYQEIGARRAALIGQEGVISAQIDAAESKEEVEGVEWVEPEAG